MKKTIILVILLAVSSLAFSQDDLIRATNDEMSNLILKDQQKGFNLCQINQDILYKRAIRTSQEELIYILETIIEERTNDPDSYRIPFYRKVLFKSVMREILLNKLKKGLEEKSLYKRYISAKKGLTTSVLDLEGSVKDLSDEISQTVRKVPLDDNIFKERIITSIESDLYEAALTEISQGPYSSVIGQQASETITQILSGRVSKELFNKALTSIGLKLVFRIFLGPARGGFITYLAYPLMGNRLSDESEWMNLVEKAPLLLLNPDWADPEESGLAASDSWHAHCLALIRKTDRAEFYFNKMQDTDSKNFYQLINKFKKLPNDSGGRLEMRPTQPRDNTSVVVKPMEEEKN